MFIEFGSHASVCHFMSLIPANEPPNGKTKLHLVPHFTNEGYTHCVWLFRAFTLRRCALRVFALCIVRHFTNGIPMD